jgi:hypothetical protein
MLMNEQDSPIDGPITLKFTGIDDESTSGDEEAEEEKITNQTQTPDSVVFTCNRDANNLTVNTCYGSKKPICIFRKICF